jgi:tetratricopeptide (TPR) repeat protein
LNKGVNNLYPYKEEQPMNVFKFSLTSFLTATLLVVPIALNLHIDRANALIIGDVRSSTHNPLAPSKSNENNIEDVAASDRKAQSLHYVELGWNAHQKGDRETALAYYQKALEIYDENAYAFAAVAILIGHSEQGNTCMRAAAELFERQGDREGYDGAMAWLNSAEDN